MVATMGILIALGVWQTQALFVYVFDELSEGTQIITQALCSSKPQAMSVRETDVTKKLATVQLFL